MAEDERSFDGQPKPLDGKAKELYSLYEIEELMNRADANLSRVCRGILLILPHGLRYPEICQVKLTIEDNSYVSNNFRESPWHFCADIVVQGRAIGRICAYYSQEVPKGENGPFLNSEVNLIRAIAGRLGHFIVYRRLKRAYEDWNGAAKAEAAAPRKGEWQVVLNLLKQTDKVLLFNISHKMLNHLCWNGVPEAEELRHSAGLDTDEDALELERDPNRPVHLPSSHISAEHAEQIFRIAAEHLPDSEILSRVQKWIQEDKLSFLVQAANRNLPLSQVVDAIRRYQDVDTEGSEWQSPSRRGIKVSLIRRFFSDQLPFINVAKNFIEIRDFYELVQRIIFSVESHGRLGGKSAGQFLALKILQSSTEQADILRNVRIPKTWYVTSDMMYLFMHYNNFDDIIEQKYKDREQIRYEYPHIVQTFKSAHFPPEMVKGISVALDDFEERPLIVRSSSLLEDGLGAVFSGKYKSLFLTNRGTKTERLSALLDAIAEVYASTFASDPIEYRTERGLLDFGEEMGVMIQQVVGSRVGPYFMPAYAGVAFSNNEFRWSPRIRQKDGLLRMVLGLGTRAVDRLSDDYPVLIAPGQPSLRVNASVEEALRYAPRYADVINLEARRFETVEISRLLKEYGAEIPQIGKLVSTVREGAMQSPLGGQIDFEQDDLVITFEGLVAEGKFVRQVRTILNILEDKLGMAVDTEFACDGQDFYLLQCRAQCHSEEDFPAPIPRDLSRENLLFTANKYVTNGRLPDITHIIYIDSEHYSALTTQVELLELGRVIGKLNKLLPKRRFILIGPGRWGSRGDIRLGVSVTYSDINNTAMLVEMARLRGQYVPDLSFGTHFFQDLVEANIRYLPLYPDDPGIVFNEAFFENAPNSLEELLPRQAQGALQETVKVIDVARATGGRVLRVLMNADLDQAVGLLVEPREARGRTGRPALSEEQAAASLAQQRRQMAETIAARLDPARFGVKAVYLVEKSGRAATTPDCRLDFLVHFVGTHEQRMLLIAWLEAWSLSLAELNYQQTGYKCDGLLEVHFVTDAEVAARQGWATRIGAASNPALALALKSL